MATSSDYDNSEANNVAHEIEDFTTADRIPAAHTKPQGETHSVLPDAAVQLQHPAPIEIDEKEGRRSVEAYLAEETDKYRPVNAHHDIARLEEGDTLQNISWVTTADGDDSLVASTAAVRFDAGDGADTLQGGIGNDTLIGGSGYDLFMGSGGSDIIDAGVNRGALDYINLGVAVQLNCFLTGNAGKSGTGSDTFYSIKDAYGSNQNDTMLGADIDGGSYLNGRWGNDTIEGLGLYDFLHGAEGNDSLLGAAGNDELYGGSGADTLDGGSDADTMEGGTGDDVYYHPESWRQDQGRSTA